ncbi:trypsin-like peptidase domain-containing protein [Bacillus sp. FJAT-27245]|uniref:trypsin-like peptidase domain-containing protein n=1 Tax=Bacillus sp. FJAT-27245 TaxID=1684144 RepID=UPI0006A7B157|nr:trypsin-like peptidase domain-containing protein [Bacillus sp. FJAT-27245]
MKHRIIVIMMTIFFFTGTVGAIPGMAKTYTPEQLVGISESYIKQVSPLINYEKSKTVKAVPSKLMASTKTSLANAAAAVKKLKSGATRRKLEARITAAEGTYARAIAYNNTIGVGERMKLMSQNLLTAYGKNPSSDGTFTAYNSLKFELGKFARSLGLVYGKSTREALSKKYKPVPEGSLSQTRTAAVLKGELNLLAKVMDSGKNDTIFSQVEKMNNQLGTVWGNSALYRPFAESYELLLKQKGLSANGLPTIIMKKIIASENSIVYLEVYDENDEPLSQGSGFIVGKSTILTNFHVVEGGYRVTAFTNDGKEIRIRGVVKYDADNDLALLGTANDMVLPGLQLGNVDYLEKGDPIIAIGSPEGLMNTVSAGIISNLHKIAYEGITTNLIQFTAPITHGSSGGALFNKYGEVIGVTAAAFESGDLNFAVGINHATSWIQAFKNQPASKLAIIPYDALPRYADEETEEAPPANPGTHPPPSTAPQGTFPASLEKIAPGLQLREIAMNPEKPILYALAEGKDVIEINLETKQARKITLNLAPERLFFANNELYVTLPKGQHSSYWWEENQEGAFAVINAETMTLIDQVDIPLDPFDIVADSESIYIISGSGQWTNMKVFSRKTLLETANVTGVRERSFLEMHPEGNKVYSITTESSPRDVESYQFTSGKSSGKYDSPYHGDYPLDTNMTVSPDGKYLFNGSGVVLNASVARSTDLTYLAKLPQTYKQIAFNLANNRFYTSSKNRIDVYDYSTFQKLGQFTLQFDVEQMFVRDRQLVVVYKDTTSTLPKQLIKTYPLTPEGLLTMPSAETKEPAEQAVTIVNTGLALPKIPVSFDKAIMPSDMNEEILHPAKPVLYGLNGKDLLEYNLDTKQTRKLTFTYPLGQLFFANNEIYVTLKKQQGYVYGEVPDGAFAVVDADSFTLVRQLDIPMDPADIVADDQYIYISNNGGYSWTDLRAYSRSTFEETGKFTSVLRGSTLVIVPAGGKLYATDSGTSPRDIQMYQFNDGKEAATYDSPYHGHYSLKVNMEVSPDGNYIFNGSGVVLQTGPRYGEDMKYAGSLYSPFKKIAFDLKSNRIYASSGKGLDIYDYSTFERIKHYELNHEIDYLAVTNGSLLVTFKEAAAGTLLPKKNVMKYLLSADGALAMKAQ